MCLMFRFLAVKLLKILIFLGMIEFSVLGLCGRREDNEIVSSRCI